MGLTGDHCWTLFLNTRNFKGPVTFFTTYFWSQICSDVYFLEVADSRRRVCRIILTPMNTMQHLAAFTFLATGLIAVASAAPE